MADAKQPSQADVMRQIQQAFQAAQAQLAQLRESVTHTAELARLNSQGNYLQMERDKALRDLGEAVWRLSQKGKLELPSSLAPAVKAVEPAAPKDFRTQVNEALARIRKARAAGSTFAKKFARCSRPSCSQWTTSCPWAVWGISESFSQ